MIHRRLMVVLFLISGFSVGAITVREYVVMSSMRSLKKEWEKKEPDVDRIISLVKAVRNNPLYKDKEWVKIADRVIEELSLSKKLDKGTKKKILGSCNMCHKMVFGVGY